MTPVAILISVVAGVGLAAVVVSLLPAQPDLRAALEQLNPDRSALARERAFAEVRSSKPLEARLGMLVDRYLTRWLPLRVPEPDLRMLGIARQQFFGEKAIAALVGALLPYAATVLFVVLGMPVPFAAPVLASVALAVAFFFIPDYDVRKRTTRAREEFTFALAAYMDLVALERASGSGSVSALEAAASVGDSWVFRRLREELARARWAGATPWAALRDLAKELRLPELTDVADIMRLSGESGVGVYERIRARARGIRNAQMANVHARAKASTERVTMPQASTAVVFMALLATPAVLRVLA